MEARTVESRWQVISKDLGELAGKKLLDLGCYDGAFCGLAIAAGMQAKGVDRNGDIIQRAQENFPDALFQVIDLANITRGYRFFVGYHAVLLLSTWPYFLNDYGIEKATDLIKNIVLSRSPLYFETQLEGDGPGPAMFKTEKDVRTFLSSLGYAKRLAVFSVPDRNATRAIWKVTTREARK